TPELVDDRGRLPQDHGCRRIGGPSCRQGIDGLAGFDAVSGGDYVVVIAGVEELAPAAAGGGGGEAAVRAFFPDVIDAVAQVGTEQRVLTSAAGGDARIGDSLCP